MAILGFVILVPKRMLGGIGEKSVKKRERGGMMTTNKYDKSFDNWGYKTTKRCWMCNRKPARSEPRFGYIACKDHYHLTPIWFNIAPFRPIR
jgi:hypothetical protein